MDTNHLAALVARAPLAEGYRFELLRRADVDLLMASLRAWYPDIGVGAASCFLRSRFYADEVQFADGPQRDVHVLALRHGGELVGMFSWDVDRDTLSMYGRLGVVDPAHRGCRLAEAGLWLLETVAAVIGAGLLYGMATLKYPHVQRVFERAGWTLVGITPGYDREMVAPGAVVIGDVTIGEEASVWYHATLHGDINSIVIGPPTNIQDGDNRGTVNQTINQTVNGTLNATVNGSFNGALNQTVNGQVNGTLNGTINGVANSALRKALSQCSSNSVRMVMMVCLRKSRSARCPAGPKGAACSEHFACVALASL